MFPFQQITFAYPYVLALLILLPIIGWWRRKKRNSDNGAFRLTTINSLTHVPMPWKIKYKPIVDWLKYIAIASLIIVLARPQTVFNQENIHTQGIDIVLSMDISGSMLANDLKPNRLEAAKEVAIDFVNKRKADRIGLVVFSGESFTQTPVTVDKDILKQQISSIRSGVLEDGTAIGMGLATAIDRLRNSEAKSKVIIILTDGVNNSGIIDPVTAMEMAKAYDIKIYAIGVGSDMGELQVLGPDGNLQSMAVQLDEKLLNQMADATGGKYFRATDNKSLSAIYDEIDQMEKYKIESNTYKNTTEWFFPFCLLAILALSLSIILEHTIFRSTL